MELTVWDIKEIVEDELGADLSGRTNVQYHADARKIYFMLCRTYTSTSLFYIGQAIKRNHATVKHQIKKGLEHLEYNDKAFKRSYEACLNRIPQAIQRTNKFPPEQIKRFADYHQREAVKWFKAYDELTQVQPN